MPQVVIVSSLGPQGPVGPQGLQGPSGSFDNISGSFVTTASFSAFTQSVNNFTASINAFTSSYSTGSFTGSFTGSANLTSFTASDAFVTGNVTVLGTASINTLIVNQTQLSTGSNQLGDAADDTQTLYGTVRIPTGSLTISGSSYFSGSVGIGTANPSFILDVVGSTRTNLTSFASQFKGDGGYANANAFSFSGNGNIGMYFPSNVNLGFSTSGNERMRIDASGSIGIGTTTPSYTLDISGSLRVGTPTATPHLIFARASNNYITTPVGGAILFNLNNSAAENTSTVGIYNTGLRVGTGFANPSAVAHVRGSGTTNATTALLVQNSNASASLVVLDNGYVGIGSATPLRHLYVAGDLEVTNGIYGDATDYTFYTIASGSFHHRFYTRTSGGTSLERFTIQGGADTANAYFQNTNLGIGIAAPNGRLHIYESGLTSYKTYTTTDAGAIINSYQSQGSPYTKTTDIVAASDGTVPSEIRLFTRTNGSASISERLRIDSSGNVGIGTTAPTARLHIVGASSTPSTAAFLVRNSNASASMVVKDDGFVGIGTTSPTGKVHITPFPSYPTLVVGRANGYSSIKASTDDALSTTLALDSAGGATILNHYVSDNVWLVTGGGSVGVGTNTPTARLHTKGTGTTSATTAFRVENSNTSASMVVLDNGYVGIGTVTPSYSLDVYGSYHQYQVQGLLARYDISSANANQNRGVWDFYTNVAVAPDFFGRFGFKFEGGVSDSFKQYQVHIGDSTTPKFIVDGAGRVAIGTITPSASLHISGSSGSVLFEIDSNSSQNILYVSGSGNVGIGTNTPTQKLDVEGNILVRAGNVIYFRDTVSYINEASGLNITSGLTRNIRLNAGGIDRLTVSASGNIGIGTTTPAATLDIQSTTTGSIRISGSAGSQITFVRPTAGLTGFVRYIGTSMDIGTVSSDGLNLYTSNTSRVTVETNGNVLIGPGGTPGGRLEIRGSGTTSATTSLRVGNSTPTPSLVITDDLTSRFFGNVGIGALPASGSLHISGAASTSSAAVYIYKSGSTTLDIQGSQGQLFSVTDALSGSLMSVNDISGLPILEVFSDDRVVMGSFSQPALLVTGSAVRFPATASTAPSYTGSEGQVVFGVVGGNAFIYAWLGGRWRSGSLA